LLTQRLTFATAEPQAKSMSDAEMSRVQTCHDSNLCVFISWNPLCRAGRWVKF